MSESYTAEFIGRIVGNAQVEQLKNGSIQTNGPRETEIAHFITVVPQNDPNRRFTLDVTGMPSEFLAPRSDVTIRISLGKD